MGFLVQLFEIRWSLIFIALLYYAFSKYKTYNRLKAFRGPFSTGFSDIWHTKAIMSMRSHIAYSTVCEKYGSIARVGPNDLITSSSELLTHINSVRSPYTRSEWFYRAARFNPGEDHLFSQIDEQMHTKRRQQMAAGYSGKENLALESSIDIRLQELLHLIRSKYASSKPMDLARKVQYFTLDVISDIGFGKAFGDLKADADLNDYAKSSEEGLLVTTIKIAFGLMKILEVPMISRLISPSEKDKAGFGKMRATARSLIDSRMTTPTDTRSDMLASFIRHGLTQEEILSEALLQILAGSDTTATAIRGIMLFVMTHGRVYSTLQAEIDAAVKAGRAPHSPGIISDTEARNLRYLQAVIREGIRVHPPVTDIFSKRVPDEGDTVTIDGKSIFLPGGTNIGYCAWSMHRQKSIFGDDVEEFKPERWLIEDNEKTRDRLAMMYKTSELTFGYGKYQCLGKFIAMMEVGKCIFELMRNFDWGIVNPEKPWKSRNRVGIFVHRDMWVQVSERQTNL
ncbi:cytochrome P450 [Glonium stellatum]|uniref:Cytochrome P450 monooxygenase ABA1 n=1 Tax=Glonium stellatum TaxID=574774 RepID=A0A8E2F726_9PEZI|nr:cytochrome P450 [Glonium stellatum]